MCVPRRSWWLAALAVPERLGGGACFFVGFFFYLNPRTEQNPRNGREGDKIS